jgi:hypothetical protein
MSTPVMHRIPIPQGVRVVVRIGDEVMPDQVLAMRRAPGAPVSVPVAGSLRQSAEATAGLLVRRPGAHLEANEPIARRSDGREVLAPFAGLFLAYSRVDGNATLAPLGPEEPVIGHVRGTVTDIDHAAVTVRVPGARLDGVGGTGDAVHGELVVSVHDPGEELRAAAVDISATGRIIVGGSRASAETLTRARAMGVAGIVLGGVLDKELRDFEAIQRRRREVGGLTGEFALLLVEGFGKVGLDPQLFTWFQAHAGHMASLFGGEHRLYVYDASPPPERRPLPRVGERVIVHRRPFQGRGGVLVGMVEGIHASPSGVAARAGMVRFEDGRVASVPLTNLEATQPPPPVDRD